MNTKHLIALVFTLLFVLHGCANKSESTSEKETGEAYTHEEQETEMKQETVIAKLDTAAYQEKIIAMANADTTGLWPIQNEPFPLDGAILPFKRVVAYYGNLYSKKMGALGEYPPKEVWERLNAEVDAWEKADSLTPVQPAIHYIAVVAQGGPMSDGTYCKRMPDMQIDSALAIAKMGNAIVFLDIQVGLSTLQKEVPLLEKYLKMPHVHLGIDPEFSMKDGSMPGKKIGWFDAEDINFCVDYLANLVKENDLTPKILVVHRFTQGMVKNYKNIKLQPEVQIVMHMDGWGEPVLKFSTYNRYIYREPVQFTGFKLFYKNDLKKSPHRLLTPPELLKLKPQPVYIQYQ